MLRTIARREPRILDAKGIAGVLTEMRFTWKGKGPDRLLHTLLFRGQPPDAECRAERSQLVRRFRAVMRFFETTKAPQLWSKLQEKREGYDPKRDGPSDAMALVDDVLALRDVEAELRKEAADDPSP